MSTDLSIEQIIAAVQRLEGALVVAPAAGDPAFPDLAWGDAFFYYAPDGEMPRTVQPYGTIVTKDYPDDTASNLDPADRWRVNVHVDRATYEELVGEREAVAHGARDLAASDVVLPHPVYAAAGWVSVVNPGRESADVVLRLLRDAHDAARARFERRHEAEG